MLVLLLLPAIALAAIVLWLAYPLVEPAPPRTVIMSTGSKLAPYHAWAEKYAAPHARAGVTLELLVVRQRIAG